jgi:hypothetical protein
MSVVVPILSHTPPWAFAVLAILVFFGVRGLRERTMSVWRLLVVPAVFIAWGGVSLSIRAGAAPALLVAWLAAAAAGFAIGWLTTRLNNAALDRAAGRVRVPGSPVPLLRNLSIFLVKYALAAASAIMPGLAASLAPWDIGVSGLAAGYFLGWLARFALRYRGAATAMAAR